MLYTIEHRVSGAVLFSLGCGSFKLCVEAAVKSGADLRDAYLGGADLRDAYLGGAYLGGADLRDADLGGADLGGAYLGGAYLGGAYLGGADLRGAYLGGAYLGGADLGGAYLGGAYLGGADLIDGGQDARGHRFYAWRDKEAAVVVYRAGCHEWTSINDALAWYGASYPSDGDRTECIARLNLLHSETLRRWPAISNGSAEA